MFHFKQFSIYFAMALAAPQAIAQGLSDAPIQSTRAESMGGVIPTIADDKDAVFENPAGIGGVHRGKIPTPIVRKLYFPYASVAANKESSALISDMRSQGAINDSTVGKAVIDANAGQRQYARLNTGLGLVMGRMIALPYYDAQVAATAKGGGSDLIDFREISTSGIAYGASVTNPEETIALGYSGYYASRSDLSGDYLYDDIINKDARSKLMKDDTTKSTAVGHNIGLDWRIGKRATPTIGLVLKNVGGTHYKVTQGPGDAATVDQDLTAAFSVSPQIGKSGELNFNVAADRLLTSDVSFVKKYHVGAELALGGVGSYAAFALRAGANSAGGSGGLAVNLGLVGFEAGLTSKDIGVGSAKVIERRRVFTGFVNVADF